MDTPRPTAGETNLIALLTEQRDLYRRLRELGRRQRTLISGDRPDQLLTILQDRQTLITSLTRLNERMAPYRRDWDDVYARLSESVRHETSALLNEINELLRGIVRTDQEDSALLSARKQSVATELNSVAGGQSATSAYAQQAGPPQRKPSADLTG